MNYFEEKDWKQEAVELLQKFQVQHTIELNAVKCVVLTDDKSTPVTFLNALKSIKTCVMTNIVEFKTIFVLDIVEDICPLTRKTSDSIINRIVNSLM